MTNVDETVAEAERTIAKSEAMLKEAQAALAEPVGGKDAATVAKGWLARQDEATRAKVAAEVAAMNDEIERDAPRTKPAGSRPRQPRAMA